MRVRRLRALVVRLAGLYSRGRRDRETAEELESHLLMEIEETLRAGMGPREARRRALVKLGGAAQALEECRRRRGFPVIEDFWKDLRYGARKLRKSPGFALVAVMTLALGIGANTAIFSVVNAVLLRPLPFAEPERLVMVFGTNARRNSFSRPHSYLNFADMRAQNKTFDSLAAYAGSSSALSGTDAPEQITGVTS